MWKRAWLWYKELPPKSMDNYLGPWIYHDANQRPSQLKKCEGAQFPAVPQSVAHPGWTCSYMQECFSAEEGILPAGTAMSKCSEGQTNRVPTSGLHGQSSAVTIHRGGLCQAASNRHLRVGDSTHHHCVHKCAAAEEVWDDQRSLLRHFWTKIATWIIPSALPVIHYK